MAQLTINLSAIKANYKILQDKVGSGCEVAGVVKANAYGLGVGSVAQALKEAGCKTFFVATLPEAMELRLILGDEPTIAMLNGYLEKSASLYLDNNITPVLNDIEDLRSYKSQGENLPAIVHIDTAMNRLGMDADDITPVDLEGLNVKAIMSHFASSEDNETDLNDIQVERFEKVTQSFEGVPKCICNSSGIFLNDSFHYEMVRPGMALYGLNPTPYDDNPMQAVIMLDTEILQMHDAKEGEFVGYNATHRFDKSARLAIVDIGYADGIFRSLSNNGNLYWNNIPCPIRGRVSMDLLIVDLCNIPLADHPKKGDGLEVIGVNQTADDLAKDAGTIGYEILTSLSRRYERKYITP
jgi:alanine racemase